MIVFHVARPAIAEEIDRSGFEDATDTYLTDREWTGCATPLQGMASTL